MKKRNERRLKLHPDEFKYAVIHSVDPDLLELLYNPEEFCSGYRDEFVHCCRYLSDWKPVDGEVGCMCIVNRKQEIVSVKERYRLAS